jgi:metal transporter CNNM
MAARAILVLSVGPLSISELELEFRSQRGDEAEQNKALKLIARNSESSQAPRDSAAAVCIEALPIFLDRMVPSRLAMVISTTLVVIFGEVVPKVYRSQQQTWSGVKAGRDSR